MSILFARIACEASISVELSTKEPISVFLDAREIELKS